MGSSSRHVEIAGAGLVGLTAASVFARAGWTVRVHERSSELREIGAGIILWGNALRSLDRIGALETVRASGHRVENAELRDERHRVIQSEWLQNSEMYAVMRRNLHKALADSAEKAGAEIVTNSIVSGASPDGVLHMADGRSLKADLIVGADGVHSRVRDSLNLARRIRNLGDGCGRYLIPRRPEDGDGRTIEEWHGGRRFGLVPCSPESTYIFLCCPASDREGIQQQPLNRSTWLREYPHFASQLDRIEENPDTRWAPFYDVQCVSWHRGRVAILGDAAHAMSPNLGQSVCVSMTNAIALSSALERIRDVEEAVAQWDASERSVADRVQRYSRFYGRLGTAWPRQLLPLRSGLVWSLGNSKTVQRRINFAAEYVPSVV